MTAQISERIIIEGQELALLTEPLEPLLKKNNAILRTYVDLKTELVAPHTACWRGYIGTWELKDNSLYLIAFKGYKRHEIVEIKDIFQHSSPIKAVWFSGKLRIPIGRMVQYVHSGYASSFSDELTIKINKGNAVDFIYDKFHLKKIKILTSTMFSDKPTYGYGYEVDYKDSFNISQAEMIDMINKMV